MFTDTLVLSTLSLAYPNNSIGPSTSFPARVNANIGAVLALYTSAQETLQALKYDLRLEWEGVSKLNVRKRRDWVWLARNKLVAMVGVGEGLREKVVLEARGLEEEIKGLEGRLRRGEDVVGEGDGAVLERGG